MIKHWFVAPSKRGHRRCSRALARGRCSVQIRRSSAGAAAAQSAAAAEDERRTGATSGSASRPARRRSARCPAASLPPTGRKPADEQDYRFDFHGFLTMPLRVGLNKRAGAVTTEQKEPGAPRAAGRAGLSRFVRLHRRRAASPTRSWRSRTATPWSPAPRSSRRAPPAPPPASSTRRCSPASPMRSSPSTCRTWPRARTSAINVGAFSNRYGTMGEYDEGHYGTPIIGRTNGVGENVVARFALGDLVLAAEQGFQGQLDKPPVGLVARRLERLCRPEHRHRPGPPRARRHRLPPPAHARASLHAGLDSGRPRGAGAPARRHDHRGWAPTCASRRATSAISTSAARTPTPSVRARSGASSRC